MITRTISGATIAAAAASLLLVGATTAPPAAAAQAAKGKCTGLNACKGQGSCKTLFHSCKGQNACKGQGGAEMMSKAACAKAGGKFGKA